MEKRIEKEKKLREKYEENVDKEEKQLEQRRT